MLLLIFLIKILIKIIPLVFLPLQHLPYIPINKSIVKKVINSKCLENKKIIIDLGCGTGSFLKPLAKKYLGTQFYGVDNKSFLVWLANLNFLFIKNKPQLSIGDMFDYNIKKADVIVGWWIPRIMNQLVPKIEAETKLNCVIVSYMFEVPLSKKFKKEIIKHKKEKIFVYTKIK